MPRISYNLDEIEVPTWQRKTWYCQECGRVYGNYYKRICPTCGKELEACTNYEWDLTDAIKDALEKTQLRFKIIEQYPIYNSEDSSFWYWDIFIGLYDMSASHACGELIEVYDPRKITPDDLAKYSKRKIRATMAHFEKYAKTIKISYLAYNECIGDELYKTAIWIVESMQKRIDRYPF